MREEWPRGVAIIGALLIHLLLLLWAGPALILDVKTTEIQYEVPVKLDMEASPQEVGTHAETLSPKNTPPKPESGAPLMSAAPSSVQSAVVPDRGTLPIPTTTPQLETPVKSAPPPRITEESGPSGIAQDRGGATPINVIKVIYPKEALNQNMVGQAEALVVIDASGQVDSIQLTRSTGYRLLDDAFIRAIRNTKYSPKQYLGVSMPDTIRLSHTFRLD